MLVALLNDGSRYNYSVFDLHSPSFSSLHIHPKFLALSLNDHDDQSDISNFSFTHNMDHSHRRGHSSHIATILNSINELSSTDIRS